jgi:hypothetical protein
MDAFVGTIMFVSAKLFGYFLYFSWLKRYGGDRSAFAMAMFRLLLGVLLGAAIWAGFSLSRADMPVLYMSAILLARLAAWTIVIGWAFPRMSLSRAAASVLVGTLLSYLIDVPVFFGVLTAIGGIC